MWQVFKPAPQQHGGGVAVGGTQPALVQSAWRTHIVYSVVWQSTKNPHWQVIKQHNTQNGYIVFWVVYRQQAVTGVPTLLGAKRAANQAAKHSTPLPMPAVNPRYWYWQWCTGLPLPICFI
jgi:hypothetical protein